MDKLDYAILEIMLKELKATGKLSACTRKSIHSKVDLNMDALYRRLKKLLQMGHIANGIQEQKEHTYFVMEAGKKKLQEVME